MLRLTRDQVRAIDRLALDEYKLPGIVLMENASRAVADAALEMLVSPAGKRVLIFCGGGNNGGDGLAVARHLHNRGCRVTIALAADPARYRGDALTNWNIARAMALPTRDVDPAGVAGFGADLLIDAVYGTGLAAAPRDPFPALAAAVNNSGVSVLAVDLPSGLDCDTGRPPGACIRAARTVTFVAEKIGFANPEAYPYLGRVTVGDIGCPRELVERDAGLSNGSALSPEQS